MANPLPEGTDQIINGAGVDDLDDATAEDFAAIDAQPQANATGGATGAGGGANAGGSSGAGGGDFSWDAQGFKSMFEGKAQNLFDGAGDRARDYVTQGLDKATTALDDVVRMVNDAASTIDDKVGAQYGDYARQASGAISGFADTLRMKDADTLFEDARDAVRKSPAIAIGAAAALGFVVARIIKAGTAATTSVADDAQNRPA